MVQKAVRALATLKEYRYEAKVLDLLLAQRLWRRGKRARWYERRAVLQTRYLCVDDEGKQDTEVLRRAMEGVQEALKDEDTGIGEFWSWWPLSIDFIRLVAHCDW